MSVTSVEREKDMRILRDEEIRGSQVRETVNKAKSSFSRTYSQF